MKNETRFFLAALFSVILISAAWAVPPATHNANVAVQAAAQTQSASGTVSAVDKASFTITLAASKQAFVANVAQQDPPKSTTSSPLT